MERSEFARASLQVDEAERALDTMPSSHAIRALSRLNPPKLQRAGKELARQLVPEHGLWINKTKTTNIEQ